MEHGGVAAGMAMTAGNGSGNGNTTTHDIRDPREQPPATTATPKRESRNFGEIILAGNLFFSLLLLTMKGNYKFARTAQQYLFI